MYQCPFLPTTMCSSSFAPSPELTWLTLQTSWHGETVKWNKKRKQIQILAPYFLANIRKKSIFWPKYPSFSLQREKMDWWTLPPKNGPESKVFVTFNSETSRLHLSVFGTAWLPVCCQHPESFLQRMKHLKIGFYILQRMKHLKIGFDILQRIKHLKIGVDILQRIKHLKICFEPSSKNQTFENMFWVFFKESNIWKLVWIFHINRVHL